MWSDVLPLAVAMMAGPQIISALVFITAKDPVRVSLAYIGGITLATVVGVYAAFLIFRFLFPGVNVANTGTQAGASFIEILLVLALIGLSIWSFMGRKTSKPPEWLNNLAGKNQREAFRLGWLVIWLMPTDVLIILTAGIHLARGQQGMAAVIPFIFTVALIAALPLLSYLLFRSQMHQAMPGIRRWIDSNGWLINIFVYVLFIFIIL